MINPGFSSIVLFSFKINFVFRYSFMSDKERHRATQIWQEKWDQFIDQMLTRYA